jgi:SnoaL-like domain
MATVQAARPDPAAIVSDYLRAMEARDLARAARFLAPGAQVTFPGGVRLDDVHAIVAASAKRYRVVQKRFERIDVCADSGGWIVYNFGTLYGEWFDGRPFAGVRYIDRFELDEHGLIRRQDVWNDAAIAQQAG